MSGICRLLALFVFCTGCTSTKVRLPAKQSPPPQGKQRIALIGIRGPDDISRAAHDGLVAVINESPNYQLFECPEAGLSRGRAVPTPLAVKLQQGRMLGANLLLEGAIKARIDKNEMGRSVSFGDPTLIVTLSVKLFDVETGQITFNDSVTESMKDDFDIGPRGSGSVETISIRLAESCSKSMADRITENMGPIELELAGATFGKHASHLRSGIAAAQAENWPLAQGYFQRALAEKPKSHEALYNLGVSHEALGQYAEAARLYKLAGEKKNQAPYRMAARRAQRAEQEIILAMAKAQRVAMLAQQTHQHHQQQPGPAPPNLGGQFSAGPPVASGRAAAYFHGRPVYVGRTGSGPIRRLPPVW